jgi:phenylalanine-4-hydroxylase
MRTKYRIDDFQQNYFVVPSFEHLLDATLNTDFGPLYSELAALPDIDIAAVLDNDKIHTRGTQDYARTKAAA